jgi:broad specificity phosphatase PhoE
MAVERYFVMRHGASEANIAGYVQGMRDVPLAMLGKKQALAAGDYLRSYGITRVFTSPLQRTLETALLVAERLAVEVSFVSDLRARNLGDWAGKDYEEIKQIWSDLSHPFRADPDFAPPNGESFRQLEWRLFRATDKILQQTADQLPLLVLHLEGAGIVLHRVLGKQRPSLQNAEVWEIQAVSQTASQIFVPPASHQI